MRDAVETVSREKLVESAAPSHPPFRVLVDALTLHAAREQDVDDPAPTATAANAVDDDDDGEDDGATATSARVGPEAFAATWNETLRLPGGRRVTLPEAAAMLLKYGVSGGGGGDGDGSGSGSGGGSGGARGRVVEVKAPVESLARALLGAPSRVTGKLPLMNNRSKARGGEGGGSGLSAHLSRSFVKPSQLFLLFFSSPFLSAPTNQLEKKEKGKGKTSCVYTLYTSV